MTNNLAQRAAHELSMGAGEGWTGDAHNRCTIKTVSRLLAKNDALQAEVASLRSYISDTPPTRRSEPMPEPVPEYIKRIAFAEYRKAFPDAPYETTGEWVNKAPVTCVLTFCRLIWERGDRHPNACKSCGFVPENAD